VNGLILLFPNGDSRPIVLKGVPRVGETIRLKPEPDLEPAEPQQLEVEHVLWLEADVGAEPTVLLSVKCNEEVNAILNGR
jgi:hypothetical protein